MLQKPTQEVDVDSNIIYNFHKDIHLIFESKGVFI